MGAVIGVLASESGKPLDRWGFMIGPNAVVSFIVTLGKSSFLLAIAETISQLKWLHFHGRKAQILSDLELFDEASCSPLGSLKLVWVRHKNSLLASCAPLVVLAALFVDPFVQLVFNFPSQRTLAPLGTRASFQTAQTYDPSYYQRNAGISAHDAGATANGMQAAILNGLYNGTTQPLSSCPTGNCTWTELTTLGVCGGCEDITSAIKANCTHPSYLLDPIECSYQVPSNATLWSRMIIPHGEVIPSQTRWNSSALEIPDVENEPSATVLPALLNKFVAVQIPQASDTTIPPPKASRCTFNFCQKRYSSFNVTDGVPASTSPIEQVLTVTNVDRVACAPGGGCGLLTMSANSSNGAGGAAAPKAAFNFTINIAEYTGMQAYLEELFFSGWSDGGSSTRGHFSGDFSSTPPTAPDVGKILANAADLNQTVRSVADSMTESIRTGPNSTAQLGQAYVERTFIQIQWGWLVYPIVLMLLTLGLLIVVILETRRHDVIAWKSSSLAMLFHQLEGWEASEFRGLDSKRKLDDTAKRMRGRVFDEDAVGQPAFTIAD